MYFSSILSCFFYNIYRSEQFDGDYNLIDSIPYPKNEYVDISGKPSYYYKIEEIGGTGFTVSYATSQPISGDELLTKSSLRFELEHLLTIPIYDEEVIFNANRTSASLAFPHWNYAPRPQIRITGASNEGDSDSMKFLSENTSLYTTLSGSGAGTTSYPDGLKYKTDYLGNIYFIKDDGTPCSIQSYDTVMASYNIKIIKEIAVEEAEADLLQIHTNTIKRSHIIIIQKIMIIMNNKKIINIIKKHIMTIIDLIIDRRMSIQIV